MINEKQKKDEEMIWVRMKSQCSKISKHDEILSLIIYEKPDVIHVGMINGNFTRSGQYSSKFIDLKVNHCLFPLLVAIFCTHVT